MKKQAKNNEFEKGYKNTCSGVSEPVMTDFSPMVQDLSEQAADLSALATDFSFLVTDFK